MAAPFAFCNRKPLIKRNEDISSCLRDEILTNFWSHFGSLGQGFLRPPTENEEKALGTRLGFLGTRYNRSAQGAEESYLNVMLAKFIAQIGLVIRNNERD